MKRNFEFNTSCIDGDGKIILKKKTGFYENIEGFGVGICETELSDPAYKDYSATELETGYSFGVYEGSIKKVVEQVRKRLIKHKEKLPEILGKAKDDLIKKGGTFPVNNTKQ